MVQTTVNYSAFFSSAFSSAASSVVSAASSAASSLTSSASSALVSSALGASTALAAFFSAGFFSLFLFLNWLGAKLHDYHRSIVALTIAKLQNASIATLAISELTLSNLLEYLAYEFLVTESSDGETTRVEVALLCPGDDFINIRANFLSASLNRLDAVVGEQRTNQALASLPWCGWHRCQAYGPLLVMPHLISPIASN